MRVVLLGPPGVGKGSLASLCERRMGVAHLSAGEIFRQEISQGTAVGTRVRRYVSSGALVPDRLVVEVMAGRLRKVKGTRGFVLDGFPRTERQAKGLDRVLAHSRRPLEGAVALRSPESVLVKRLSGRRVCERCGANYHIRTIRPRRANRCDRCGGCLIRRKDDEPATIRRRLSVDRAAARPLVAYYRRRNLLYPIDGSGPLEAVYARMVRLFRREGWLSGSRPMGAPEDD